MEANSRKQVVALANGMAASAAYWISAAADSVWASSDVAMLGSIGVVALHTDISERQRAQGLRTTEIFAGRYKTHGSPHAPLSDEARTSIQGQVDYLYSVFVNDVATFRGVSTDQVLQRMADGRVFFGSQAVGAGLAEGIASRESLIDHLAAGTLPRGGGQARIIKAASVPMARVIEPPAALPVEEQCKLDWQQDAALRAEFCNSYEVFLAYSRAAARGRSQV